MRNLQTFLRMETPPLQVGNVLFADGNASFTAGDVPFTDGNAAARTFGRAHRRRPYHFSYGSCHKIAGEVLAAAQNAFIVVARCSPLHKKEFIVVARCSPLHKKEFIVAARCSPLHKHE